MTPVLNIDQQVQLTRQSAQELAQQLTTPVHEGEVSALDTLAYLTFLKTAIEHSIKDIQSEVLNESDRYVEKVITRRGVEFQKKEAGVKYDFTDDKDWNDINSNIEDMKALLKGRETTLRQLGLFKKTSTSIVQVTLPKQ